MQNIISNVENNSLRLAKVNFPMGIRDSISSVDNGMALPVIVTLCPLIGALATNVKVDVHGQMNSLNLMSYIVGNAASGKGSLDPIVEAWMKDIREADDHYHELEDDYRRLARSGRNAVDGLDEPRFPVRFLALNNTVANLAERLANTNEQHAFSFTPEADIVAQRWRSTVSDFSVMIRQAYDGSRYEREARTANAATVHIKRLLWNVVMCGTKDALFRVINNFTNGLLTRFAIARMPDNTFEPLADTPFYLSDKARDNILQVSRLLQLMSGELHLDLLEQRGRRWLERVRIWAVKDDDRTMASQRMRICVTTQRMLTAIMLCAVAEKLIATHGFSGAESALRDNPQLLQQMMVDQQTNDMLSLFDIIADSMLSAVLELFRDKIESLDVESVPVTRQIYGKNDTVFDSLPHEFNLDNAAIAKGVGASLNSVRMMIRNWIYQGLIRRSGKNQYVKNV